MSVIGEVVHQMALIPLLFLGVLRLLRQRRDVAWWWLAGAFFVSWLADTGAHVVSPWVTSIVYPLSQAAIIGAVLLPRADAIRLAILLVGTAFVAVTWHGVEGPDVLLRTVAWGSVVAILYDWRALGKLRTALLVMFGGGWLAWICYVIWPGWISWLNYQETRLVGMALFCRAAWRPVPRLRAVS